MALAPEIRAIYTSPQHVYFGHHGKPPGREPMQEQEQVNCVAGAGIEGDRFFSWTENYKGQITFFEEEVYDELCGQLETEGSGPSVFRRNVVTRGIRLQELIGERFTLQGVMFEGSEEASPCYWMDEAFAPGAEELLRGRGGLRARILSDGVLSTGPADHEIDGS